MSLTQKLGKRGRFAKVSHYLTGAGQLFVCVRLCVSVVKDNRHLILLLFSVCVLFRPYSIKLFNIAIKSFNSLAKFFETSTLLGK